MTVLKVSSRIKNVPVSGIAASAVKNYVEREQTIDKFLKQRQPGPLLFIQKMKWLISESGTTIINALGTGLVAPIFIAYNPLSKTDDNTKKYTAMRQPVSAVLAVVTQVGLSLPLDKLMARMSNDGGYKHDPMLDQTLVQDESYLTKYFKKLYKGESKEQIAKRVNKTRNEQFAKAIDTLKSHNNLIISGKPLPAETFKDLLFNTLSNTRKELFARLTSMREKDMEFRIKRAEFVYSHPEKVQSLMIPIIRACKNEKDLDKVQKVIHGLIYQLRREGAAPECISILDEFRTRDCVELIENRAQKHLVRIKEFAGCPNVKGIREMIMKGYDGPKGILSEEYAVMGELIEKLKHGGNVAEIMQRAAKLKEKDFLYEMVKSWVGTVKTRLKKVQSKTGLISNLIMLPITCSMLNWVYPRLMDRFFPELSSKKAPSKQEGGAK